MVKETRKKTQKPFGIILQNLIIYGIVSCKAWFMTSNVWSCMSDREECSLSETLKQASVNAKYLWKRISKYWF